MSLWIIANFQQILDYMHPIYQKHGKFLLLDTGENNVMDFL